MARRLRPSDPGAGAVAFIAAKLGTFVASENAEDLDDLRELIEAGKVTPVIDRSYPLAEVPAAIRYLLDGHARGKLTITV